MAESECEFKDDSDKPKYLKRGGKDSQLRKSIALLQGKKTALAEVVPPPLWRLEPPEDDPETIRRKKASWDAIRRTIYTMKRSLTEGELPDDNQGLPDIFTNNALDNLQSVDIMKIKEKSYIKDSSIHKHNHRFDREHFNHQILQDYKKPISEKKAASYCSPSDVLPALVKSGHDPTDDIVKSVVVPSRQQRVRRSQKQKAKRCDKQDGMACHYCDVLGPQTCSMCIEKTNRYIARKVERSTLPRVEGSILSLVAPNLSVTMKKGDRLKKRSNRGATRMTKFSNSTDNLARNELQSRRTSFALPPIYLHKSEDSLQSK